MKVPPTSQINGPSSTKTIPDGQTTSQKNIIRKKPDNTKTSMDQLRENADEAFDDMEDCFLTDGIVKDLKDDD